MELIVKIKKIEEMSLFFWVYRCALLARDAERKNDNTMRVQNGGKIHFFIRDRTGIPHATKADHTMPLTSTGREIVS